MGDIWILLGCLLMQMLRIQAAYRQGGKPPDLALGTYPKFWFEYTTAPVAPLYYDEYDTETSSVTEEPLPYFESDVTAANITAQLGDTAYLHCRVHDLRDKTVSWLRRKDDELHLLTVGQHTYSSDSRYSLSYQQHPNDWKLQIKYANKRDEGLYECQVSSHPPIILYVQLNVVVPKVEIVDDHGRSLTDKFYKAGSTIELKCVISQVPHPSSYVTWRHGDRMLNYDTSRGGISVKTDIMAEGAVSKLYIANANKHDSGNYTCSLADVASSTSIMVHVLNGENPAAMQHGSNHSSHMGWSFLLICMGQLFTLFLVQR